MKKQRLSNSKAFDQGRRKSIALLGAIPTLAFLSGCNSPGAEKKVSNENIPSNNQKIDYDLKDPKDQLLIFEKLRGEISGKQTYSFSEGRVFGIRPDQPEDLNSFGKEVFRYTGCSIRIKRVLENGNVETKSRSWLLYQDPVTGDFIDEMKNPYTGEVVEVPPFRGGISGGTMTPNGPIVNANFKMESTAIGSPLNLVFNEMGGRMHITRHAFTKWLEKKTNTYRTEWTLDTYDFANSDLYNRNKKHIPSDSHWTSQTSWLSLLKMSGTPGHMLWTSSGRCLFSKDDLPTAFVKATEEKQPDIFATSLSWEEQ